ncbi:hypothetical protein AGDE_14083 [Angomonas deanei]|nr:hypothetical protein AGDE_14083 [Angomonas deanei]|eukprot:EPY21448.1 hypothetical protein AGDE_14083 [Angomonas deanei]
MKKKDLQNFFSRCKKLVEQNISTNTKGKTAKSASVESPLLLLTLVYFYFHQNKNNLPSAEQKRLFHLLQTDIRSGLASLKEEEKNENNQQKEEDKLALKYIKQFIFHPEGSTTTLKRKRARPGEEAEEGYAVRSFHGRAAPQEEEESEEDSFNFEEEINELFASSGQAVRSILDRRQTPLYGEVVDPLWEREGDHGRARPPLSLLQLTVDAMEHKVNRYWDALQQHLLDPCLFFENPLDHRFLFNDALVCIPRHVVNSFVLSRRLLVFALWSSYDGQHGGALLSDRLALYASRVLSPQDEEHGECPVCSHMHPRLEGDSTSEGGDSDTHHVKNKSTHDATEGDDTKQLLRRTMTERVSTRREAAGHTGWFAIDGIRRHEKADTTEGRQTDPLVLLLHRLHALAELLVYCGNRSKRHLRQLDGQLGESGSVPLDPFQYFSNMIALDSDRNTPSQFTWVLADTGITPSTLMSRTLECLVTDILLRDTADGERPPVPFRSQVEYVFSKKNNPETATESPHTPVSLSTTVNRVSLLTSQPNTLYTEGYTQDTSNHSTSHLLLECVQCFRTFHQSCLLPSQREESLYTQVNTNLPTSLTAEDTSAEHDSPPQCLSGFRCHQCRLTPCTAPMEDTPYILPPLAIQTTETAS